jgi:hypothetical protein
VAQVAGWSFPINRELFAMLQLGPTHGSWLDWDAGSGFRLRVILGRAIRLISRQGPVLPTSVNSLGLSVTMQAGKSSSLRDRLIPRSRGQQRLPSG